MSEAQRWNEQNGTLWMEKGGFRLVIHPAPTKGYVRFAVIDHRGPMRHPDRLIGSGTFEDIGTAKDAAERMAECLVTKRVNGHDQRRDAAAPPTSAVHRSLLPAEQLPQCENHRSNRAKTAGR
jgi:hypothetical protein